MLPVDRFVDFINQNKLFDAGTPVLAAVSGGMDSVLMAHLLKAAGFNFAIAHCNFMLRGDAAGADQEFTRQLAASLGVNFHTTNFDTEQYAADNKISIQMAARELRYKWFAQLCQTANYTTVSLAHHQNDTIETILLNLTRGTRIAGLHGILPKNGNLVRPLLFLTREEVAKIVAKNNLVYVEDASNASVKYARNKIRHQVVPVLKELNPNLEETVNRSLQHFRELEQLLEQQVTAARLQLLTCESNEVHIPIAGIRQLSPKRLLLIQLLVPYGFLDNVVDDLLAALDKHPGRIFESSRFTLVVDRVNLIITERGKAEVSPAQIAKNEHTINYGNFKLTVLHDDRPLIIRDNPLAVSVDADLLVYPLTLRSWQQGDQFYPLGMKTRQKLSDFFIHQKIPLQQKQQVPVLVNGNGDILWLGGYRPDNRYRVTDKTKKVTIFELNKL